jgi:hypothetical protein
MTTIDVYLVPKYDRTKSDFGEGDGFFVGQRVAEFLKKAATSSGNFDDADFWWSGTSSGVAPIDLVCYVFDSIDQSLVAQHMRPGATLKSKAGNTVWSPKAQAMISEVYIAGAMYFAANLGQRDRVLAISIIHELMHNKLDLYPYKKGKSGFVTDLHATKGKAASQGITYFGDFYDDEDVKLMAAGIGHQIPQYTAAM